MWGRSLLAPPGSAATRYVLFEAGGGGDPPIGPLEALDGVASEREDFQVFGDVLDG